IRVGDLGVTFACHPDSKISREYIEGGAMDVVEFGCGQWHQYNSVLLFTQNAYDLKFWEEIGKMPVMTAHISPISDMSKPWAFVYSPRLMNHTSFNGALFSN